MASYLLVPVRLDALLVEGEEMTVVSPSANFSRLPFVDRNRKEEVNDRVANLSEAILPQPFQDEELRLRRGVHLHWAMPDALTRGGHGLEFPLLPNRWLVTRRLRGQVSQQWVIESDYLHPPEVDLRGRAVCVPYLSTNWTKHEDGYQYQPRDFRYQRSRLPESVRSNEGLLTRFFKNPQEDPLILNDPSPTATLDAMYGGIVLAPEVRAEFEEFLRHPLDRADQPFRYMGRRLGIEEWLKQVEANPAEEEAEYYPNLTAVAYGDPTFAAFYPNCFSVFGLHDDVRGEPLSDLQYALVGWYSDESHDVLAAFIRAFEKEHKADKGPPPDLAKAVLAKFNWEVGGARASFPQRFLCYAALTFGRRDGTDQPEQTPARVSVTVANTPAEALAACLANKLTGDTQQQTTIEDQLVAIDRAFQLDRHTLDIESTFERLRHESGFVSVDGGSLWTIRKKTSREAKPSTDDSTMTEEGALAELPAAIADELHRVNSLQRAYDVARREIDSMRRQLFADWYKYMLCVYRPGTQAQDYPKPDLVKFFIETKLLDPLREKLASTGEIETPAESEHPDDQPSPVVKPSPGSGASLATELAESIRELVRSLEKEGEKLTAAARSKKDETQIRFILERIPAPRFWQPNNPVVLIEGDLATLTDRHEQGTLQCGVLETNERIGGRAWLDEVVKLLTFQSPASPGVSTWRCQPWNPFLLEWQVDFLPSADGGNLLENTGQFTDTYVIDNYSIKANHPDFEMREDKAKIMRGGCYYGQSILTAHAAVSLREAIEAELVDRLGVFPKANSINPEKLAGRGFSDPRYTMAKAHELLTATETASGGKPRKRLNIVSQTLSGFNHALLMQKTTFELAVEDPLGFDSYRHFSDLFIREAMGRSIGVAPSPVNRFNPIRSGCLKIRRLRLVDTFGQARELSFETVGAAHRLKIPSSPSLVYMPPRLVQPARLEFRWLDAEHGDRETNSHGATTPICGWLLTNRLDGTLMLYDAAGGALGYFQSDGWQEAIDSDAAVPIDKIGNRHLRDVAASIQQGIAATTDFLADYIEILDASQQRIHPEEDPGQPSPAMLLGRPIAVVRATLNLELSSSPALNQDWNVFRRDMAGQERTDDNFPKVRFPVRIGEYGQLNDGLVGYWIENRSGRMQSLRLTERNRKALVSALREHLGWSFPTHCLDRVEQALASQQDEVYAEPSDFVDTLKRMMVRFLAEEAARELGSAEDGLSAGLAEYFGGLASSIDRAHLPRVADEAERMVATVSASAVSAERLRAICDLLRTPTMVFLSATRTTVIFNAPENPHLLRMPARSRLDHFEQGTANFYQSIADPPQQLTMLVDVTGTVRATIGILPCKEISIPPDQYAAALRNIQVSFKHAPILTRGAPAEADGTTPRSRIELALRPVYQHAWSWVERVAEAGKLSWREVFPGRRMEREVFERQWRAVEPLIPADRVWRYLLREDVRWLAPLPDEANQAVILDKKERKAHQFFLFSEDSIAYDIQGREAVVEEIFDVTSFGIVPASLDAVFAGQQEIREGWLKLRQVAKSESNVKP